MKRKLAYITVTAAIAVAAFFIGYNVTNTATETNNLYAKTTIVTDIDRTTDTVIVIDSTGNEWAFYGCEDWQIDDVCSMLMDTAGTESIYDDIIVSAVRE